MKRMTNSLTLLGNWKTGKHESDVYTNSNWCYWYSHRWIIKGTGKRGNNGTNGDHPNYSIVENGQNTEKSPGDLRRLTVTQTSVTDNQLALMWKTLKEKMILILIIMINRSSNLGHTTGPTDNLQRKKSKKRTCQLGKPQSKFKRRGKEQQLSGPH